MSFGWDQVSKLKVAEINFLFTTNDMYLYDVNDNIILIHFNILKIRHR